MTLWSKWNQLFRKKREGGRTQHLNEININFLKKDLQLHLYYRWVESGAVLLSNLNIYNYKRRRGKKYNVKQAVSHLLTITAVVNAICRLKKRWSTVYVLVSRLVVWSWRNIYIIYELVEVKNFMMIENLDRFNIFSRPSETCEWTFEERLVVIKRGTFFGFYRNDFLEESCTYILFWESID